MMLARELPVEIAWELALHEAWCTGRGGRCASFKGADLRGQTFRGEYLRFADFSEAKLRGADFRNADLQTTSFKNADMHGADLRGANLLFADLRGADLRHADLRNAGLQCAILRDANLAGANIDGADLEGAEIQYKDSEELMESMDKKARYFVDRRGGCIAVRDRNNTDPDYFGLHQDTRGVIRFWCGTQRKEKCPTCGHLSLDGWQLASDDADAAYRLCTELNAKVNNSET